MFISRLYIDWQDKTSAAESFARLKELWYDRDVLIVEGHYPSLVWEMIYLHRQN